MAKVSLLLLCFSYNLLLFTYKIQQNTNTCSNQAENLAHSKGLESLQQGNLGHGFWKKMCVCSTCGVQYSYKCFFHTPHGF